MAATLGGATWLNKLTSAAVQMAPMFVAGPAGALGGRAAQGMWAWRGAQAVKTLSEAAKFRWILAAQGGQSLGSAYIEARMASHGEAAARGLALLPLVEETYLSIATGEDLETASERIYPRLRAMSSSERRQFMAALQAYTAEFPDQTRQTFFDHLGEVTNRGLGKLGRGLADAGSAGWAVMTMGGSLINPWSDSENVRRYYQYKLAEHDYEGREAREGISMALTRCIFTAGSWRSLPLGRRPPSQARLRNDGRMNRPWFHGIVAA